MSKFLSGERTELEPVYDSKVGYRYSIIEAIVGGASDMERFLNKLYEAGDIRKKALR